MGTSDGAGSSDSAEWGMSVAEIAGASPGPGGHGDRLEARPKRVHATSWSRIAVQQVKTSVRDKTLPIPGLSRLLRAISKRRSVFYKNPYTNTHS